MEALMAEMGSIAIAAQAGDGASRQEFRDLRMRTDVDSRYRSHGRARGKVARL